MRPFYIKIFLSLFFALPLLGEVKAFYLSWYDDPSTTMTIQWISPQEDPETALFIESDKGKWLSFAPSSEKPLRHLNIYAVYIEALKSDTSYRFKIGENGEIYSFKTAPEKLSSPLRFAIGGDVYLSTKLFRRMCKTVVEKDPLFVVLGGDIAYALSIPPLKLKSTPFNRWVSFLSEWQEAMITEENRVIPFLLASGNHDIEPDQYELFFTLFAFHEKQLYRAVDFGDYLSLILLDTGHFQPIAGRQSLWLKSALSQRQKFPYRFAVYHEGAYPSFYPYNGKVPKTIRSTWCPIFDEYRISAAFENHNHAYKKTYPLKGNKIDPKGTIYFGDGSWGVPARKTSDMWYLEQRGRKNNVYLIDLSAKQAEITALGLTGEPIDLTLLEPIN